MDKAFIQGWLIGRRLAGQRHLAVAPEPDPYTPIEHVQFDGEQYIDTGILCTQDTKIDVSFMRDNTTACYLYGVTNSGNTASVTAYMTSGSGNWRFGGASSSQTINKDVSYDMKVSKDGIERNGTLKEYSGTVGEFVTPQTLALGCNHAEDGGFGTSRFVGKVYSFKMYDGENLVLDYVPAISNGVYGFWDMVAKKFVPSHSGTPFTGL